MASNPILMSPSSARSFSLSREKSAVIAERLQGQNNVADLVNDNAVVLEFGNIDAYKIQGVNKARRQEVDRIEKSVKNTPRW